MDTKEIEVIKNHRPISHGLFVRRRSIGPLPSCFALLREACKPLPLYLHKMSSSAFHIDPWKAAKRNKISCFVTLARTNGMKDQGILWTSYMEARISTVSCFQRAQSFILKGLGFGSVLLCPICWTYSGNSSDVKGHKHFCVLLYYFSLAVIRQLGEFKKCKTRNKYEKGETCWVFRHTTKWYASTYFHLWFDARLYWYIR